MENENDNDNGETEEESNDSTESTEESKPKETPQQRLARLERQAKQLRKKLGIDEADKPAAPSNKPSSQLSTTDLGTLAYLAQNGVEHAEDISYINEVMQTSGLSLVNVLSKSYVQAELKERQANRKSQDAIPSNSRRSASNSRDKVDYWIAKGEMPPADQVQLRREYVNKRAQIESVQQKFSKVSVIGG